MLTNVSRAWAGKPPSADEVRKRKAGQPRFGSHPDSSSRDADDVRTSKWDFSFNYSDGARQSAVWQSNRDSTYPFNRSRGEILRKIPRCRAPIGAAIQSRRTQIRSGLLVLSLRTLRQKRRWSQTEMATRAGVRQALVSAIEVESANIPQSNPWTRLRPRSECASRICSEEARAERSGRSGAA